jgi:hypothetical protein
VACEKAQASDIAHRQYVFTVPRLLQPIVSRAGAPGWARLAASPRGC